MKPNKAAAQGGLRKTSMQNEPLGSNSEIGRKLKQYYDGLVSDEVPDRFADLLRQLEQSETSPNPRDGE